MVKYDERGNVIERVVGGSNEGLKIWFEYDEKDQCIHEETSQGYEAWWEYDSKGREVSYKNSKGIKRRWHYDDILNTIDGVYCNSK